MKLMELRQNVNGKSNNYAEMYAVYMTLEYILQQQNASNAIHIFTDSMLVQDILVENIRPGLLHELTSRLRKLASKIDAEIKIHWIP